MIKTPPAAIAHDVGIVIDAFDRDVPERTRTSAPVSASHERVRVAVIDHYELVWRSLRRLGVAERSVDDAAQQVLVILARRIDDVREGAERAFMLSTAIKIAADFRKKQQRSREVFDVESLGDAFTGHPVGRGWRRRGRAGNLQLSPKNIHLAIDVRVEANGLDNDGYSRDPVVIQLVTDDDDVPEGITLRLRSTGAELSAFALETPSTQPSPKNVSSQDLAGFTLGQWVSVTIDIERSDTKLLARIAFDGSKAGEVVVNRTQNAIVRVAINLGSLTPASAPEPFVVACDNLLADVD